MRLVVPLIAAFSFLLSGCSTVAGRPAKVFAAGEKATVDRLTYTIIDTQIAPRLGDDVTSARIPQNRFYIVQLAVSNAGNSEVSIPGLTLVDDSGKTYNELPDGSGLPRWLGVVRRVAPAQTEEGTVLFDAPAAHYKLKLTEESDDQDVFADLPLSYVHERTSQFIDASGAITAAEPPPPTPGPVKKAPAAKK